METPRSDNIVFNFDSVAIPGLAGYKEKKQEEYDERQRAQEYSRQQRREKYRNTKKKISEDTRIPIPRYIAQERYTMFNNFASNVGTLLAITILTLIPVAYKGKNAIMKEWQKHRGGLPKYFTLDSWCNFNTGIPCGETNMIIVIDADKCKDPETQIDGVDYLNNWGITRINTWKVQTPSGGIHLYFKYKPEYTWQKAAKIWRLHGKDVCVDLLTNGSYVMAPGSVHPNGGEYKVISGFGCDNTPIADLPETLIKALNESKANPESPLYQKPINRPYREYKFNQSDLTILSLILNCFDVKLADDWDSWVSIGWRIKAITSRFGMQYEGFELWDDFSKLSTKYNSGDDTTQTDYLYERFDITDIDVNWAMNSLAWLAKNKNPNKAAEIEAKMKDFYSRAYNAVCVDTEDLIDICGSSADKIQDNSYENLVLKYNMGIFDRKNGSALSDYRKWSVRIPQRDGFITTHDELNKLLLDTVAFVISLNKFIIKSREPATKAGERDQVKWEYYPANEFISKTSAAYDALIYIKNSKYVAGAGGYEPEYLPPVKLNEYIVKYKQTIFGFQNAVFDPYTNFIDNVYTVFGTNQGRINSEIRFNFNLFMGFQAEYDPHLVIDESKFDKILWHIKYIWCCYNDKLPANDKKNIKALELYNYILNWFAYLFQNPSKKNGVCLWLQGVQGSGKTAILEEFFCKLIVGDASSLTVNNLELLTARFNSIMENRFLTVGDEIGSFIDPRQKGILKNIVSQKETTSEKKFHERVKVRDHNHFIFCTNEFKPVFSEIGDRRNLMIMISKVMATVKDYFDGLATQFSQPSADHMYNWLMRRDISKWNPLPIPNTEWRDELQEEVMDSWLKYMGRILRYETPIKNNSTEYTSTVHTLYSAWCKIDNIRPEGDRWFLKRLVSDLELNNDKKKDNGKLDYVASGKPPGGADWKSCMIFDFSRLVLKMRNRLKRPDYLDEYYRDDGSVIICEGQLEEMTREAQARQTFDNRISN